MKSKSKSIYEFASLISFFSRLRSIRAKCYTVALLG